MKKTRFMLMAVILLIFGTALCAGAGFPTFDVTNYLQEILGYVQDGQQIASELAYWENEIRRWQQLYKAFESGDLEAIIGGITGSLSRLGNTLGRYNVSVGWLDSVTSLSSTLSDTGFDIAEAVSSGSFTARDLKKFNNNVTDLSTDILTLSATIKATNIENRKARAEEGEKQAKNAESKEGKASTILTGGSSAQTEGTAASEAIEQTTNALSDTYDALTDSNAQLSEAALEEMLARLIIIQEQIEKMLDESDYAETFTERSETLAESVDVISSITERNPESVRSM